MTCSNYRTRHPMSPAAIHPVPPPNGQGKGGIKFYYYTRPCICFFPPRNPRQLRPTAISAPSMHSGDVYICLHIPASPRFTPCTPRPPIRHPRHLKHPYPPLLTYPAPPIGVTYCYMWLLGNLPDRLLALYKYALSWATRDMSYMIRAYTGGKVCINIGRVHRKTSGEVFRWEFRDKALCK
jgi:hypothetical protein